MQQQGREVYTGLLTSAALNAEAEEAAACELEELQEAAVRREERADPTYKPSEAEEEADSVSGESESLEEERAAPGGRLAQLLEESEKKAKQEAAMRVPVDPADLSFFAAVVANGGRAPKREKAEGERKPKGRPGRPHGSRWSVLKVGAAIFKPADVERIGSKETLRQMIARFIVAPLDERGEARAPPNSGKLPYLRRILLEARPPEGGAGAAAAEEGAGAGAGPV